MKNKTRILITGAEGFIGGTLKVYFTEAGFEVYGTVFDRAPEEREFAVDFTDAKSFKALPDMYFDAVIHTVGIVDQTVKAGIMKSVNVGGTENLCSWLRSGKGTGHLIQMSSVAVYGTGMLGQNITEDTKRYSGPFAIPYMRTKAEAEVVIEKSGLSYSFLRLPAVLGKGDTYVSPQIADAMKNNDFYVYGTGKKLISLMYVKNLGSLIHRVIDHGPVMRPYNAADYHISWKEYVEEYSRILQCAIPEKRKSLFSFLLNPFNKKRQLIMTYSLFGTHTPDDALRKLTGWTPPYTWQQGVKEALESYQ